MLLFRTSMAAGILAVTLAGCGGRTPLPTISKTTTAEPKFEKAGKDIDIAGQKGVGKREGKNYSKTFDVQNTKSTNEAIINNQKTQIATVVIAAITVLREDRFVQSPTTLYYEFYLNATPENGTFEEVYVNGNLIPSTDWAYNAQNNSLYFPGKYVKYGTPVVVRYRVSNGSYTSYAFSPNMNAVGMSVVDASTGEIISGSFNDNVLIVSGLAVGRQLKVKFYLKEDANLQGALKFDPVPGSVKIDLAQCASTSVMVTGKNFSAPCAAFDIPSVGITYDYVDPSLQLFMVPEVTNPDLGTWEVRVNNEVTNVYRREGNKFYIDQPLPPGCKVQITNIVK